MKTGHGNVALLDARLLRLRVKSAQSYFRERRESEHFTYNTRAAQTKQAREMDSRG
jgi:hypothetical protein